MADANRLAVNSLVLHHAVTPLWSEKSKPQLAQWFSDNGFTRAYGSNVANWSGLTNPYTGAKSFSQAHFAGQIVDGSTPDATAEERQAGYRLVALVDDVWGQITWHAGNWEMNRKSIGIECLGDYRNYTLRDGDCRVIANFWRPQDIKFGGATAVFGHKEVSDQPTACPARIMEMRDVVVNYINNPPVPVPVIIVKEETTIERIYFTIVDKDDATLPKGEAKIEVKGVDGMITVVTMITLTDGKETSRVTKSRTVTLPAVEQVVLHGTFVPPIVIPPVVEPPVEAKPKSWFQTLLEFLTKIINALLGKE